MKEKVAKVKFIFTVIIFGTIGVVAHFIPLCSSAIVFYRALLASIFLIVLSLLTKRKFDFVNMNKYKFLLVITGMFMGLNWVFQFMAFKLASVSVGTVCYNTMPIFVILLAPVIFKEKISFKSFLCVVVAMIGIVFVSNVVVTGINSNEVVGCIYAIIGALFYALAVMINKKMSDIDSYDKIIFQFIISAIIMVPYIIFNPSNSFTFYEGISNNEMVIGFIMILLLGLFHTGVVYVVYFDTLKYLKSEYIALFTYIDPVVALILSYIVLHEKMNLLQIIGAVLILMSAIINEINWTSNKLD